MNRLILFLLPLAFGCASLDVKVSLLDKTKLDASTTLYRSLDNSLKGTSRAEADGSFDQARGRFIRAIEESIDYGICIKRVSKEDRLHFISTASDKVTKALQVSIENFRVARLQLAGYEKLRRVGSENATVYSQSRESLESSAANFTAGREALLGIQKLAATDLQIVIQKPISASPQCRQPSLDALNFEFLVAVTVAEIAPGLFDDPNADLIVYAPEEAWKGVYNQAYGYGSFGNTDIAIKMESPDRFTVKGVRLDASKITTATFTSLREVMRTVAAANGVPLNGITSGTEDGVQDNTYGKLLASNYSADVQKIEADSRRRGSRMAALGIMESIVSQDGILSNLQISSAATRARQAAIDVVRATFKAYKPQLAPQDNTQTGGTSQ